jgi:hypothetical protein
LRRMTKLTTTLWSCGTSFSAEPPHGSPNPRKPKAKKDAHGRSPRSLYRAYRQVAGLTLSTVNLRRSPVLVWNEMV